MNRSRAEAVDPFADDGARHFRGSGAKNAPVGILSLMRHGVSHPIWGILVKNIFSVYV